MISEFVRERVIERLGLDPERVHAVWLGVDHERFTPTPHVEREPFLLYPARPWPHKNHARLFEAFAQIRRSAAGAPTRAHRVGHDPRSLPEGVEARSVSERSSSTSTAAPRCLVFPSLYEGFGLPPSRRWPAGARSPRLRPARCRRSAATPPCCSTRLDPEAIAAGIDEALSAPRN